MARSPHEIIVKFNEGKNLSTDSSGNLSSKDLGPGTQIDLPHFFNVIAQRGTARQCFPGLGKRLLTITDYVQRDERQFPGVELYVRVRGNHPFDPNGFNQLLNDLQAEASPTGDIATAMRAVPSGFPAQDRSSEQGYLLPDIENPDYGGVGARYAWGESVTGDGIKVCVVDVGFEAHEDLPAVQLAEDLPANEDTVHGLMTLGVLGAVREPPEGIIGIAHGATLSFSTTILGDARDVPTAIDRAFREDPPPRAGFDVLTEGDVLVLEVETENHLPEEVNEDVRSAIKNATEFIKVTVVEASGNGDLNLDEQKDVHSKYIWKVGDEEDFDDSLAVLVGAGRIPGSAQGPHTKRTSSNYGSRLDCQGWGNEVLSTVPGGYGEYEDTSAATAMVGAVAACLQSAYKAKGQTLLPADLRDLLARDDLGTPQPEEDENGNAYPNNGHIGPLPDLSKHLLGSNPFMRDNVADTGTEPYTGTLLCRSPDIITRQAEADPGMFGPGSWGDENLGQEVLAGQDNYVYTRLENVGALADDATVTVYWADPSTFIHPDVWLQNRIGEVTAVDVQPGEQRVAPVMQWDRDAIPGTGHYCLIATVESPSRPVEIPATLADPGAFMEYVRTHNTVCYRNVEIVELPALPATAAFWYFAQGLPAEPDEPPRKDRFRLEVRPVLPAGAAVRVQFKYSSRKLKDRGLVMESPRRLPEARFEIPLRRPLFVVDDLVIERGKGVEVRIEVDMPRAVPGLYVLESTQYYRGRRLGQVSHAIRAGRGRAPQP